MPLTILGKENNIVTLLCQSRGEASELSGKVIVREKDPHLDPMIKLNEQEATQQKLADIEAATNPAIFVQRYQHA